MSYAVLVFGLFQLGIVAYFDSLHSFEKIGRFGTLSFFSMIVYLARLVFFIRGLGFECFLNLFFDIIPNFISISIFFVLVQVVFLGLVNVFHQVFKELFHFVPLLEIAVFLLLVLLNEIRHLLPLLDVFLNLNFLLQFLPRVFYFFLKKVLQLLKRLLLRERKIIRKVLLFYQFWLSLFFFIFLLFVRPVHQLSKFVQHSK